MPRDCSDHAEAFEYRHLHPLSFASSWPHWARTASWPGTRAPAWHEGRLYAGWGFAFGA